jgi:predicted metal-dependent hydrolase
LTATRLELGDVSVDVLLKDIKNVHLSVHPPSGAVTVSAPERMDLDTIRVFAISKLPWIRKQQRKLRTQERESPREYLDRESHYVWGKRFLLRIVEAGGAPAVELKHRAVILRVRPGMGTRQRQEIMEAWYRWLLKSALPAVISRWEDHIGVRVERSFVQRMKTKWGSSNPRGRTIRLNTDLAKKPPACLEYVVAHEIAHLIVPTHGPRFIELLDRHLPQWRELRDELNRLPVRHEKWDARSG